MNRKILLTLLSFLFFVPIVGAQAGSPDPSFGTQGEVIQPYRAIDRWYDFRDMALQPDGKIVALGLAGYNIAQHVSFVLIRYNADGSVDTAFGNNGISDPSLGADLTAVSLAIQPDGKILVAGYGVFAFGGPASNFDFVLARYNSDGSLDMSFGENGKVVTDLANFEEFSIDYVNQMLLQPDGKIVVVGLKQHLAYYRPLYVRTDAVAVRFNADGTLDDTFGFRGQAVINTPEEDPFRFYSASWQADGKIVVSGDVVPVNGQPGGPGSTGFVGRLHADGTLDTTFGNNGIYKFPSLGPSGAKLLQDQKILGHYHGAFFRLNNNGSPDPHFSFQYPFVFSGRTFEIQSDGKFLAAGMTGSPIPKDLILLRYTPAGELDRDFGERRGYIIRTAEWAEPKRILIQRDGKILVGATLSIANKSYFFIARYLGDAAPELPTKHEKFFAY